MRIVYVLIMAAAAASLMFGVGAMNEAAAAAGKQQVIHVGGKVLCQDCTQGWNEWVNGAKPLKGCRVSVLCQDVRRRVVYYGSDLTDEAGDFELIINKYINGKQIDPKNCFTRLVSSPDPVCNIATDFAGGKTGVKLHRPTMVYRDMVKYVLGSFYYTTPMCDEPDTSNESSEPEEKEDDSRESNY